MKRQPLSRQDQWPDWHQYPLKLNLDEMNNPLAVLEVFFTFYSLVDIREKLKVWLEEAFYNNENPSPFILDLYEDIQKLVEAAYLIQKRSENHGPKLYSA